MVAGYFLLVVVMIITVLVRQVRIQLACNREHTRHIPPHATTCRCKRKCKRECVALERHPCPPHRTRRRDSLNPCVPHPCVPQRIANRRIQQSIPFGHGTYIVQYKQVNEHVQLSKRGEQCANRKCILQCQNIHDTHSNVVVLARPCCFSRIQAVQYFLKHGFGFTSGVDDLDFGVVFLNEPVED